MLLFVGILELVFPRTGTALQVPALARDLLESPLQLPLEWPWIPENILEDDYEAMSFPQSSVGDGIVHWSLSATVPSTHRNYTIHTGSLSSGLPKDFSFQIPEGGNIYFMEYTAPGCSDSLLCSPSLSSLMSDMFLPNVTWVPLAVYMGSSLM